MREAYEKRKEAVLADKRNLFNEIKEGFDSMRDKNPIAMPTPFGYLREETLNDLIKEYEDSKSDTLKRQVGGTHYKNSNVPDHWDLVEALGWNYRIGNATKYLWRLGKKGGPEKAIEDLEKAIHYLQKELEVRRQKQLDEEEATVAAERAAAWKTVRI